jgi:hypothetical protein
MLLLVFHSKHAEKIRKEYLASKSQIEDAQKLIDDFNLGLPFGICPLSRNFLFYLKGAKAEEFSTFSYICRLVLQKIGMHEYIYALFDVFLLIFSICTSRVVNDFWNYTKRYLDGITLQLTFTCLGICQ